MVTTMQITSDPIQRFSKMKNGTVFDSPNTFVTELIQNAFRAGAKNLWISFHGDEMLFMDDGVGSRSPKSLLTLDYSEWESTDEGFGIGIWSVLAIPNLKRVDFASRKWRAHIDIEKLFATGKPEATIETIDDSVSGFIVNLKSDYFITKRDDIKYEIWSVGELQPFNIFVAGNLVTKRSMLDDVDGDFVHDFSTRKFTARFAVGNRYSDTIKVYYEKRFVTDLDINGVDGVIELSKKGVDLKEPDRKSIIKNEKHDDFKAKINECREVLYLKFLQYASDKEMDKFAYEIKTILHVSQYEKYVMVEDIFTPRVKPVGIETTDMEPEPEEEEDVSDYADSSEFTTAAASVTTNLFQKRPEAPPGTKILLKDAIKMKKRKMWCGAGDRDRYAKLISKAEYYGCTVFIAANDLHENIFEAHRVPHISDLENGVRTTYISNNVKIRNEKEYNFLKSLIPICRHYKIPDASFKMGDLKMVVSTYLNEVLIDKEVKAVGGMVTNGEILLDRRAMKIKRFNLRTRPGIGTNELKCLMANMPVISHELAHLLYGTADNTLGHWETMERIQHEIAEIYREM